MKTKEQLKDIKLFADFIGIKLIQEWEDCTDTKTSIHIGWIVELSTDLVLGRFVYKTFNPEEDWNLLHKAYEKISKIDITNVQCLETYHKFLDMLEGIDNYLVESNKEKFYEYILEFIKLYLVFDIK